MTKCFSASPFSGGFLVAPLDPMPCIPVRPLPGQPGPVHPGAFGVPRHQHIHTGVDLYAPFGCPVRAMEDGKIISIAPFTGPSINMDWWNDTQAVYIDGDHGVFCYGEIQSLPTMKIGKQVKAGDVIGYVLAVLKKYKGRPMSMLHVELYDHGYTDIWGEWKIGAPQPKHLHDPTCCLSSLGKTISKDPYLDSVKLYQKSLSVKKPGVPKGKLTLNQYLILKYLYTAKGVWFTPTFIAEQVKGKPYHSSWSSPILLRLAEKGLVERENPGHYKITNWGRSYVQGSKIVAKYEGKTIL
jgi:hypothetical protein